jgi:hypothetical protein
MLAAKPRTKDASNSSGYGSASTAIGHPRLILHAECPSCGFVGENAHGASAVQLALAHSASTGHVVVLNGTTDLPEMDDSIEVT